METIVAKALEKEDLCIYSFTRTYGEMVPARDFIQHITNALQMIEAAAGSDLSNRDDREVIDPEGDLSFLLMTLNFEK